MHTSISRLLTNEEVRLLVPLCRSTLHLAVKCGEFPSPIRVGSRRLAWRSEDVQRWIDSRPVAVLGVSNGS